MRRATTGRGRELPRLLRLVWAGSGAAVIAAAALLVSAAVIPVMLGWSATVVMSGSMEPAVAPGDVIVTSRPSSPPRIGQIVRFPDPAEPGRFLLHRVV